MIWIVNVKTPIQTQNLQLPSTNYIKTWDRQFLFYFVQVKAAHWINQKFLSVSQYDAKENGLKRKEKTVRPENECEKELNALMLKQLQLNQ